MMRKYILAFISLLLISNFALSQIGPVEIGVVGGPTLFSIRGYMEQERNSNPAISYAIGLNFESRLTDRIALKTNLLFEDNRFLYFSSSFPTDDNIASSLVYNAIALPISGIYYLGKHQRLRIGLGICISWMLNGKSTYYAINSEDEFTLDAMQNYTNFNYGISGSIGYTVPISTRINFMVDIVNTVGLKDIFTVQASDISHTPNIDHTLKTNSLRMFFGVSYRFSDAFAVF